MYWEQRKLGEIGIIITGSTPSTSIKYYYTDNSDEGIVWVTPTDIINNITVESEKRLTSLGQKVAHIVPKNTILVTCIASIGKNTMLIDRGSFNQQINGLIPYENKYEPYFLLTESFIWSNKMKSSAPAGTMQIVNRKEFSEIDADIPDKSEQNSVGAFFRTLDHLITLHQSKFFGDILKTIASYTLYWEQRKLGEMYTQLVERNIELLPFKKILSVSTMTYKGDGNGAAEESLSSYKRLRVGDIAFEGHTSKDFRYGRFVLNDTGDGIMSPRFSALRPISVMPIKFWKYYIHYEPIMKKILVNSTKSGTMMNELVVEEFLKEILLVPEEHEQQKIGRFFNGIDHLITLHQLEPFQLIFKAIAYRIIDYAKSKPPRRRKYTGLISFIK
nr:restriction endonuclease subunit S [uncultured Lachnoanaerobaculum sp.]